MIYLDPKTSRAYADTRDELDEAARIAGAHFSRLVPADPPRLDLTERQARRLAPIARFIGGRDVPRIARRYAARREAFRVGFALRALTIAFLYLAGTSSAWSG